MSKDVVFVHYSNQNINSDLWNKVFKFPLIQKDLDKDDLKKRQLEIFIANNKITRELNGYLILENGIGGLLLNVLYIEVHNELVRKGLGSKLLKEALNFLSKNGQHGKVTVYPITLNAKRFFSKNGFSGDFLMVFNY